MNRKARAPEGTCCKVFWQKICDVHGGSWHEANGDVHGLFLCPGDMPPTRREIRPVSFLKKNLDLNVTGFLFISKILRDR